MHLEFYKVMFIFDATMLRQVVTGLLLLLHVVSFVFVPQPDEQDCYAVSGKMIDQSGSPESDYYLYSSDTSLKGPAGDSSCDYRNLHDEKMYSHSCFNILSPPPEHATL
jgi:hypothetical protein